MPARKPINFKITKSENHALLVQIDDLDRYYTSLHQHPEYQITANVKGEGILYAGNTILSYTEGDVIFVGSNVPHLFKTSPLQSKKNEDGVLGISLFFDILSFGEQFFELKELHEIKDFLTQKNTIIKLQRRENTLIYDKIISTRKLTDADLVVTFLEILSLLVKSKKNSVHPISYAMGDNSIKDERLNNVIAYTFSHSYKNITIEEIAAVAHLSKSQFSHFFKVHTGKSFIQFLNELRIENACILLKEKRLNVNQVGLSVGFNNTSNFNRQFLKYKSVSPSEYRRSWD